MQRTGYDGRVKAVTFEVSAVAQVVINICGRSSPSLPGYRRYCSFALRINKDQRLATDAIEVLFHNSAHQQCGNAGIERITAF